MKKKKRFFLIVKETQYNIALTVIKKIDKYNHFIYLFVCLFAFNYLKVYILWIDMDQWPKMLIFEENKEEKRKQNTTKNTFWSPKFTSFLFMVKSEFRTKFVIFTPNSLF